MAKAILEFNLNDPEDIKAHIRAVKSLDMALALWDMSHNTKKKLEWAVENKEMTPIEVIDLVFDKFYEILENYEIDTDKLVD